jgi:hypothetical protein
VTTAMLVEVSTGGGFNYSVVQLADVK